MAPIPRLSRLASADGREAEKTVRPPAPTTRARKRRPLRPAEDNENLTRRESQVLACFAQGLNTEVIAQRLSISTTTVRNHSQRILSKLGVHSRLEAVARGYETGLLSLSPVAPEHPEKI